MEAIADEGREEGVEEEESGDDEVDEVCGGQFKLFANP